MISSEDNDEDESRHEFTIRRSGSESEQSSGMIFFTNNTTSFPQRTMTKMTRMSRGTNLPFADLGLSLSSHQLMPELETFCFFVK